MTPPFTDVWKPADGRKFGLMGHVVGCYPTKEAAKEILGIMVDAGVDVIEIQIPFSEPMADGPLFMQANQEALDKGVTVADSFELMAQFAKQQSTSRFVFMTYLNIAFQYGYEAFVKDAVAAGAAGVIVPDLPVEYSGELDSACDKHKFANIRLVTPNMSPSRLKLLGKAAKGMVYAVARAGVTGKATHFGEDLAQFLDRVRQSTAIPIGVGFGVRGPEDVRFLKDKADYAIIGTQALRVYQKGGAAALQEFWASLKDAAQ